jgi:hypothetical protein
VLVCAIETARDAVKVAAAVAVKVAVAGGRDKALPKSSPCERRALHKIDVKQAIAAGTHVVDCSTSLTLLFEQRFRRHTPYTHAPGKAPLMLRCWCCVSAAR